MDSMTVLGNTFLDNPKKRKKKKAKKPKREKLDKQKSKPKDQQSLKDYADICDSNLFAQWPEIKKKKRKKKPDVSLNEEFPLTQNKNLKLSKRHKQNRKGNCAVDTHTVEHGVRSGPGEQDAAQPILSSIQKEKKHKKRVVFNLSPVLLEPKPLQNPFVVRDILQTQCYNADAKKPSFNSIFPAEGRHSKPAMEENGTESQSTSDDINSQDLFITQKSFSDPYIDLCSSTSAEEALEPQGYTETFRHWSTCTEVPMDLSLPKRSRLLQWEGVSKASDDQRHPEPSVTDLTQSDDSDSHLKSKADLSQLKVVQTRLNESFFFKLKGEGDSPKPRSPLMKFAGSVEKRKP
ncbi:hypothetical protein PDJAM_G00235620 [Pangasius djambal]|uniref:Uncharacterized protein n=1 Tax=Pangasius djambal TaxID=1691987 RepID=A0ACC5YFP1_9TELE|nr:hypothetical protein [Pangasius djambal]